MKVTVVRYEKLINLGNYENQKVGVEVALEDGENPAEAIRRAQAFVEKCVERKPDAFKLENAKEIVANQDEYSPKRVREAQEFLRQTEDNEVPF